MKSYKFPRISLFFNDRELSLKSFTQIKKLGQGTFGQVALYLHNSTQKPYAIKRISFIPPQKSTISREQLESQTKKELQILYKIDNPSIIQLLDHFEGRDDIYLITEYIEGSNLYDQTLKIGRHLPVQTIALIIYQICDALQQLHNNHIIHRDIKLENVMFSNEKTKIVDLGCSNFFGDSILRQTMIGTKCYWSPEIVSGEVQNDRLDVWCVGVILWQLLFLEQPFEIQNIERNIRKCEYRFPRDMKVESELQDLFKRVFVYKNSRMSITELKNHTWIRKYRRGGSVRSGRFQDYFSEYQTIQYKDMLSDVLENNQKFIEQIKSKSGQLEAMLKESKKQLRKR